jgi:hypothetical protein
MKKYLLVGGAPNVGKSGAIYRLTNDLLDPLDPLDPLNCKGFNLVIAEMKIKGQRHPVVFDPEKQENCQEKFIEEIRKQVKNDKYEDFMAILCSKKDNNIIHIAINSATDVPKHHIKNFRAFIFDKHANIDISIFISSIRNNDLKPEVICSTQDGDVDPNTLKCRSCKQKHPRKCFFLELGIRENKGDIVIELPLAKIKGPEVDLNISQEQKEISLKWYEKHIDIMLKLLVAELLNCQENTPKLKKISDLWWSVELSRQKQS